MCRHVTSGLIATFIEAPIVLQNTAVIPPDHYELCGRNKPPVPTSGNAAGNVVDLLDLSGEPAPPPPLPAGFTTKGVIALIISIFNGILMVAMIANYGLLKSPAAEDGAGNADECPDGENRPLLAGSALNS